MKGRDGDSLLGLDLLEKYQAGFGLEMGMPMGWGKKVVFLGEADVAMNEWMDGWMDGLMRVSC